MDARETVIAIDRATFKAALGAAVTHYLRHGHSDFEERRRRAKLAALAKGRAR